MNKLTTGYTQNYWKTKKIEDHERYFENEKNIASKTSETKNDTDSCKFQLINNKAPNHIENSGNRIKTHLLYFYCCKSG